MRRAARAWLAPRHRETHYGNHPMKPRRVVASALVVLGGALIFAAPETMSGLALIAVGILVEIVGIMLERR